MTSSMHALHPEQAVATSKGEAFERIQPGFEAESVLAFATLFREVILQRSPSARMCAAISSPLCAALEVLGVPCHLVETDLGECMHVFLDLGNGLVLDPTADQFNWCSREQLPGVYLGAPAMIHQDAEPWPGGKEWRPLMAELKRLHPSFTAHEVGRTVGLVLRTLPPGVCDFETEGG